MNRLLCFLTFFISLSALAEGPVSDTKIKLWANNTVVTLYNYDYKSVKSVQKDASGSFTLKGWQAYISAYLASGLQKVVEQNKYTVSSITMRPPTIASQGKQDGHYQWVVKLPMVAVYKNETAQQVQYLKISITVFYQDNELKIDSFYAKVGKVPNCPESKDPPPPPAESDSGTETSGDAKANNSDKDKAAKKDKK